MLKQLLKPNDAYLVGYYGMRNSGDDALMYACAWGAKNRLDCETTKIGLYGEHQRQTPATHQQNLQHKQAFSGQNRLNHYQAAIQSKRIIFGGGAVLHSESDINLKRHLMKLSGSNNSLALGVSIGPFQSLAAEKSCAKFLNECRFTGVRDQASLEIATSIAPQANVKKTFDLAPLLLCYNQALKTQVKRKGIALSLCSVAISPMGDVNEKAELARIEKFCQLIIRLYRNTGEPITLVEFNGHEQLGDWKINQAILARLPADIEVNVQYYHPDPITVLNSLAQYKAVISMRLHGAILGYLADTPVMSLNYHEKCQGWCEQIGMPKELQSSLIDLDINQIANTLEHGLSEGFAQPLMPTSTALKQALGNWHLSAIDNKTLSRATYQQVSL
ncbi:polysaccharide pyruvyl transferase family protein [Thalassotalea sp. PLHSN55]|uniref:polysaccharide pyruvyl transferase family protein n=1 Tax=Thalassotalea sp. PLHSN55 TaxID=3435888 RepID=UPI003F8503E2